MKGFGPAELGDRASPRRHAQGETREMKALTDGKALTVSRGTVLIDGGCIVAVGADIVVFVDGKLVYMRSGGLS